jgi:flavin reductase (NADH)
VEVSNSNFKQALSQWASGVSVVTYPVEGENISGVTVSAFSSLSMEPPLILVCIQNASASLLWMEKTKKFCVNILTENQIEVSKIMSNPITDRSAFLKDMGCRQAFDLPLIIPDCMANLICELDSIHPGGDHKICIGKIVNLEVGDHKRPLLYFSKDYHYIQ